MNPIKFIIQAIDQTAPAIQGIGQRLQTLQQQVNSLNQQIKITSNALEEAAQDSVVVLAKTLGISYSKAEKFAGALGMSADKAAEAIAKIRELNQVKASSERIFATLSQSLGVTAEQFEELQAAADPPSKIGGLLTKAGLSGVVNGMADLSSAIGGVYAAFQSVMAAGSRAFDMLIGQNERLNQQLLNAAAGLTAGNQVIRNSIPILDPTESIKALQGPMRAALKQVQQDAINLVGVTSGDLTGAFETLISKSAILANQSKELADPIEAAGKLTIDFAAALGSMGLGMAQAQQEIGAILTGNIDINAQLSRSLNITNKMVQDWRSQGVLVDKLRERLAPFTAANALAAQSISGVMSNIKDVFEIVAREAGEPLLQPVVAVLQSVFEFLSANQQKILEYSKQITGFILTVAEKLTEAFNAVLPALAGLGSGMEGLASGAGSALKTIVLVLIDAFVLLVKAIAPVLNLIGQFTSALGGLTDSPLGGLVIQATLLAATFKALGPLVLAFAGQSLSVLTLGVSKSVAALTGLKAALLATQTQGLAGLAAGLKAALPGLAAFGKAALAALGPLLPLIAIGGAIAITFQILKFEDAQSALDSYDKQLQSLHDQALKTATELQRLADIEASGGKLTEEQLKRRQALLLLQQGYMEDSERLRDEISKLQTADEAQESRKKALAKSAEDTAKMLQGSVKVEARALADRGNSYKQMADQVTAAQTAFKEGASGDPMMFEKAVNDLISLTQKQVEAGQISEEEARRRLDAIAQDGRVSLDLQQQAQTAANKLIEAGAQERLAQLRDELSQGNIDRAEYGRQAIAILTAQFDEEQKLLDRKRQQVGDNLEAQAELDAEEAALRKRRQDAITQLGEEQLQAIQENSQREQTLLESKYARGLITQEEYNQQAYDATVKALDAEIAEIQRQKEAIGETNKSALKKLEAQEAEAYARRQRALEEFGQRQIQAIQEKAQQEQAILDGQLARGLVSVTQYNQQVYNATVKALDAELAAIQKQKEAIGSTNKEALEKLKAQESGIYARRQQALQQFQREQLAEIQRQQQRVMDAIALATAERETQIQELLNTGRVTEAEVGEERVAMQRRQLEAELEAEEQKRKALEQQQAFTDPRLEEERQTQIRQSRIRTAQITQQLAQNEFQRQQAMLNLIREQNDRQLQRLTNKQQVEELSLQRAERELELMGRTAQMQNQLLEARRGLQEAVIGAVQSDLNILSKITTSERERQQLAQATEAIKLRTLRMQQEGELENLRIQRQQNELARERERIELRRRQMQNAQEQMQARGELEVLRNDPRARPEQIMAAELRLQSAMQNQGFLAQEAALIDQQAALERQSFIYQEQALRTRQQADMAQAQFAFANSLPPAQRRQALRQIQQGIFSRYGASGTGEFNAGLESLINETAAQNFGGMGGEFSPVGNAIASNLLPSLNLPAQSMPSQIVQTNQGILNRLDSILQVVQRGLADGININQQNQIVNVNDRSSAQGGISDTVKQQLIDGQYEIVQRLKQRMTPR